MAETLLAREKYFKNGRKPLWARKTLYGRQKCSKDDSTPQSTAKTLDYWENPSLCGGQKPSIGGKPQPLRMVEALKAHQESSIGGKTTASKEGTNPQSMEEALYGQPRTIC